MKKRISLLPRIPACLILYIISVPSTAQTEKIEQLIQRCLTYTVDYKINDMYMQNALANYAISLGGLKPEIALTSNLPGLTRSINSITQPDGTNKFLPQSQSYSSLGVTMSQKLVFSGGSVTLFSGLNRLANFEPKNTLAWQSSPFVLTYSQPLFQLNTLRFQKQVATMGLRVNEKRLKTQNAQITFEFVSTLFDQNLLQYRIELNRKRLEYMDEMIKHTAEMVDAGNSLKEEKDLLLLEKIKAEAELFKQQTELKILDTRLEQYLGGPADTKITLGETIPPPLDSVKVFEAFYASNSTILQGELERYNAELDVKRLTRKKGLQANLDVSFGLNQKAAVLTNAYQNLSDQQRASVSIRVPIWDGKQARNQLVLSKDNLKILEYNNTKNMSRLAQQIFAQWTDYQMSLKLLNSDKQMAMLSEKRFKRYKELYEAGKVTIDEMNQIELTYNGHQIGYLQSQVSIWKKYYQLKTIMAN